MRAFIRALQDFREPAYVPYPSLAEKLHLMPGSLVIAMGAPGVGKSIFALDWSLEIATKGHWTRLLSLDTPASTQAARVVSKLTQSKLGDVVSNKEWALQTLESYDVPMLVMDQGIPPENLGEVLELDRTYLGKYPEMVVIDDLVSMRITRDYDGLSAGIQAIKAATRRANCVTLLLHHLHRGGSDLGNRSPKLTDLTFTGEYDADVVLGLWRPSGTDFRVSILKNRLGEADPGGGKFAELRADMEYCSIREWMAGEHVLGRQPTHDMSGRMELGW